MAKSCFNTSSKEFKALEKQVGSRRLAELICIAKDEIPTIVPSSEIKRAIGFKSDVINFGGIASKLKKYNAQNNTSHYFTYTKKGQYNFTLEMKYNYLPVNIEKQRQRMAAKNDPLYVINDFDAKGFNLLYPSNTDVDDIIPEYAAKELVSVQNIRKNQINSEIVNQRRLLAEVEQKGTLQERQEIKARLYKLKQQFENVTYSAGIAKNVTKFEEVLEFGNQQIAGITELLQKPEITIGEIAVAQRIINLWKKAGDFSMEPTGHLFLDEYEFQTDEIKSAFRLLKAEAEDLEGRIRELEKTNVNTFVQRYHNRELTNEEIWDATPDVNRWKSETLNISRYGDPMLTAAFSAVQSAEIATQDELYDEWEKLDSLIPKFLRKAGGNYNILKQTTTSGKETGRMVNRFATEFFSTRNDLMRKAFNTRDPKTNQIVKNSKAVKEYFDWVAANTITFDPRILFEDSQSEDGDIPTSYLYKRVTFDEGSKQQHIAELKKHLGEKGFAEYLEAVEKKIKKFQQDRIDYYDNLTSQGLPQDEVDALFDLWNKENSPYWGMDMQENPASRKNGNTFYTPHGVGLYTRQVPRRVTTSGNQTEWYDKNFEKIEADEDLLAFYNYTIRTLNKLNSILPENKQKLMGVGVLPRVEKSLLDLFRDQKVKIGVAPLWDAFKKLQTTTDFAKVVNADQDPLSGQVRKEIQIQFIADNKAKIDTIVKTKVIAFKQREGRVPTIAEMKSMKEDAAAELSREQSWDIGKILKAYSLTVTAYKHKLAIDGEMRLLEQKINERQEVITNKAGEAQVDSEGRPLTQQGLANLKGAFEFFMDSQYYGIGGRKVQGVSKTKLYTKAEAEQKKTLEDLIEKESDKEAKQFLQDQLDSLGGFRTASGVGDTILKFSTFKNLGWNFFSATSNFGFGAISNIIQAADGREYSAKSLRKAYILTMNSVGRNVSFNAWDSVNSNGAKIRKLMDRFDLNQSMKNELFDNSQKTNTKKKLDKFKPFKMQESTEYMNNAPVMIAMLMDLKAKDPEGKEVTLWDAYDVETGRVKEGFTHEYEEEKIIKKIRRVIQMNHSDYRNPLKMTSTIEGRLLSQYRRWIPEGLAARFEKEHIDEDLSYGRDTPYVRKGRYRSYTKGQLTTSGAAIGTMILPGIGTAIGGSLGYVVGKAVGMKTDENAVSDVLYTLKALGRKLMFSKNRGNEFTDRFTEHDAANMRKNMTELYVILSLMALGLILKGMVEDDDDEDKALLTNFALNQVLRLQTDVNFYTNPMEAQKLTKAAVPVMDLLTDAYTVIGDITNLFDEDLDNDLVKSGAFKGSKKVGVHLGKLLPGTNQAIRLYTQGDKIFD